MAPNSLSPSSVVIDYHSAYAPHKMTIPTLQWFPTSITGDLGSYQAWNGDPIDAEDMIMALVTALAELMKTNAAFDNITTYTQASPTAPNIPRATKAIAVPGTATTGNEAAVSATFNFKTAANGDMKIVLLDTPLPSTWFNRVLPTGFDLDQQAVVDEILANSNAWSGRDDTDVSACRSITYDLNDKLQRMYFR